MHAGADVVEGMTDDPTVDDVVVELQGTLLKYEGRQCGGIDLDGRGIRPR